MENERGIESSETELKVADFSERVTAFSIDIILFILLFLLALKALFPGEPISTHSKGLVMARAFIALFILYHSYWNAEGRLSLGKRLMGIQVVDEEGNPLGLWKSALRSAAYLLSGTLGLGFIWGLFSRDRQTWHDVIVGSVVVSKRPKSAGFRRLALAGSWCAVLLLAAVYAWELVLAEPYYRVMTVANARVGLDELGRLEQIHKEVYGGYTASLVRLGNLSGEPQRFMKNMTGLFDPEAGITMKVTRQSYLIAAKARDRKHTPLRLAGPPA